jgi:hypothetical protein
MKDMKDIYLTKLDELKTKETLTDKEQATKVFIDRVISLRGTK